MPIHAKKPKSKEDALFEKRHKQREELDAKRGDEYGKDNGVHAPSYSSGRDRGQSIAGDNVRGMPYYQGDKKKAYAVDEHRRVLGEMRADKHDRRNLADGGDISKGFNGALGSAGIQSSIKNLTGKPKMMADGGDPGEEDPVTDPMDEHESGESEIGEALVDELMTAMEHKDHKQVREAIEAIVMNCLSKGGM